MFRPTLFTAVLLALVPSPLWAAEQPVVKHPNLLLNQEEINQVKEKIKQHEWAARLFGQVKELADDNRRTSRNPREAALVYVLTGDKRYGEMVRRALVGGARGELPRYDKLDVSRDPDFGSWGPWATWAWAYDLTYDLFTPQERQQVEHLLRTAARTIREGLKYYVTTPNLVFEKHWKVGLIGYCLGDRELIEWGLNDPGRPGPAHGGFYQVLDSMIKDGHFWGEAPIYALHYDLHGMLALAEAARHFDGTDLYHHVSKKSGGSIKGLIDGYLRLAFPLERTGIEGGSIRMATFGDGSTSYSPRGGLADTFLINPVSGTLGEVALGGELEVAYHRYRDPGYAWLLSLNRSRNSYIGSPGQGGVRPIWGFAALTHGVVLPEKLPPPPAPCGVYPSLGFAMLRSDEQPGYWTAGGLAAVLRLGSAIGHGHKDYFHLILHGKGRLLYPDLNVIQYEPTWLNWTHEGIAHNTLLVDHQSPRPGPFTTRQDFNSQARFFALTGSAFEGVTQTRALVMTGDYLADIFQAADTVKRERTFDWALHGLGRLYPGNPAAYRPSTALVPFYGWIDNEQSRTTGQTWQADWVQHSAGVTPGLQRFGKEWFAGSAGVRLTMLGVPGTEVYHGDGPLTDGPPYHRIDGNPEGSSPLVLARRRSAAVTFSSVHEPYEQRPSIRRVSRIQETEAAVGIVVEGERFSDRVLVAFQPDQEHSLHGLGESFTFQDHAHVRVAGNQVAIRGQVKAFRLRVPRRTDATVLLNGKPQPVKRDGVFLSFGNVSPSPENEAAAESAEQRAALHYYCLPEEMHLRAGGEQEATLHLRCVGQGAAAGQLRLAAPAGLRVEPELLDLGRMSEGEEKVLKFKVKAAADAANGLHRLRIEPVGATAAAAGTLLVSVGVVISEDRRLPALPQLVVRAPGYTMKVDQTSGVSYYLLDGDGHRRHGSIHNTNFCYGLPALAEGDRWVFHYRQPCRFVWEGPNTLTVGPGGNERLRLRYTFHEDRIVLALVPHPPNDPNRDYTLWLSNFDALGPVQAQGVRTLGTGRAANWYFFPHPLHRQGVLLGLPEKTSLNGKGQATAVNFPMRVQQEVVLRFATAEEIEQALKE